MAKLGFGKNQPIEEKSGGLWKRELKLRDGEKALVVPLHSMDEALAVVVHGKTVRVGNGFRWIPSGNKNGHLGVTPVADPFDTHPDQDLAKTFTKRFMLVYVVSGGGENKGRVAFLELKTKHILTTLRDWENAQKDAGTGKTVTGIQVSINRRGGGQKSTEYATAIISMDTPKELNLESDEIAKQAEEVQNYLLGLYVKPVTTEWLQQLYVQAYTPQTAATKNAAGDPNFGNVVDEEELGF